MVSQDEVLRIARLANLSLSGEEEARVGEQLGRILEYVDLLRELDSEASPPEDLAQPEPHAARGDVPAAGLARADVLALAPAHDGEMFLVPAVIDSGDRS